MTEENPNPSRTGLEEITLEFQAILNKFVFELEVAVSSGDYTKLQIELCKDRVLQAEKNHNYITSVYENSIANEKTTIMYSSEVIK